MSSPGAQGFSRLNANGPNPNGGGYGTQYAGDLPKSASEKLEDRRGDLQESKSRLASAVTTFAGRAGGEKEIGDAREAVKTDTHELVEAQQEALVEAQQDLEAAEAQLETGAPSPVAQNAAQERVEAAEDRVEELSQEIVVTQQEANQLAVEDDQPLPYPAVVNIDASGSPQEVSERIARTSEETQTQILGTPSHISQDEIVQRDAAAIEAAVQEGPEAGAQALQATAGQAGVDPEYQARLLNSSQSSIEQIGVDLNERKDTDEAKRTLGLLSEVSENLGPENTGILARGIAKSWPDGDLKKLDDGINEAILAGKGSTFAVQLTEALYLEGKLKGGNDVANAVTGAVHQLRSDFAAAQETVDGHNEKIGHLVGTQSELLTEQQLQQAIDAHQARTQGDFDDYEAKAALLASALPGLGPIFDDNSAISQVAGTDLIGAHANHLRLAGLGVAGSIPDLAESSAGTAVLGDLLEQSGRGQATALDHLGDVIERADDPNQFRGELALAFTSTASATLLAGGTDGTGLHSTDAHEGLFNQLENIGVLEKGSPESIELRSAFDAITNSLPENVEQSIDSFLTVLNRGNTLLKLSPDFRDALKNNLKVHSLALDSANVLFGAYQTAGSFTDDWRAGDAADRSQLLVDALDLGVDGVTTALKIAEHAGKLSTASSAAWLGTSAVRGANGNVLQIGNVGRLPAIGSFLGGVTAVFETANAIEALSNGEFLDAGIHGIGAAGAAVGAWNALAAAGVASSIPGGQLVAVGLLAAGIGLNHYKTVTESNKYEGPTEQFLIDAGIDPDIAKELSNHDNKGRSAGPVLSQLASRFGLDGPAFYEYLQTLPPGQVKEIVQFAHGVDPNDEGVFQIGDPDEIFMPITHAGRSINGLANWLAQTGLIDLPIVNTTPETGSEFPNDGQGTGGGGSW